MLSALCDFDSPPVAVFKWTLFLADVFADLVPKESQEALHRHCRPRGKNTEGFPRVLAHLLEDRNMLFPPFPILDPPEQIPDQRKALPAGSAPAAGFPDEKFGQVQGSSHQAGLMVEDYDPARPQTVANGFQRTEIHLHVKMLPGQKARGGAPR